MGVLARSTKAEPEPAPAPSSSGRLAWPWQARSDGAPPSTSSKPLQVGLVTLRARGGLRGRLEAGARGAATALRHVATPRPRGPGVCDHNRAERVANLVTTLPYFGLAARHAARARTPERRLYAAAVAGAGAGATLFHALDGPAKPAGRKADYWAIALAATAMGRLLFPVAMDARRLTAVSLAATPVHPLLVTGAHLIAMESEFRARARTDPRVASAERAHLLTSAVGVACFFLEDLRPSTPFVHAAWHCLSAVSVFTTEGLVEGAEDRLLARRARRKRGGGGGGGSGGGGGRVGGGRPAGSV